MSSLVAVIIAFFLFGYSFLTQLTTISVEPSRSGATSRSSSIPTIQDSAQPNSLFYGAVDISTPIIESQLSDLFEAKPDGTFDLTKTLTDDIKIQRLLTRGAVHLAFSPAPGEIGNSYIVGNKNANILRQTNIVVNNIKKAAPFSTLNSDVAKSGQEFLIYTTKGKQLKFKVFEVVTIDGADSSTAYQTYGDRRVVTLQTTVFDRSSQNDKRLLVRGELVK